MAKKKEEPQEEGVVRNQPITALAAGAADELSFGLIRKLLGEKGIESLKKDNPAAFNSGRIASLFTPGLLEVKAGRVGLKALKEAGPITKALKALATPQQAVTIGSEAVGRGASNLGKKAISSLVGKDAAESLISKMLQSSVQHGTTAGTQAAAQGGIRKSIGTNDDEDLPETIKSAIKTGGALGSLSAPLGSMAKSIYGSKRIVDPRAKQETKDFVVNELMDRGIIGGEGTFSDFARKSKDSYESILAPYMAQIKNRKNALPEVVEDFGKRAMNEVGYGTEAADKFTKTLAKTEDKLGPRPSTGAVMDYEKFLNEKLQAQRARGFGSPQPIQESIENQAMGSMRGSIDKFKERAIKDLTNEGKTGQEAIDEARKNFSLGRNVERALDKPANWPGVSILRMPGISHLEDAATSLPVRTATGVGLDRAAKGTGYLTGRLKELGNRNNKSDNNGERNPYLDSTDSTDESNPYMKFAK